MLRSISFIGKPLGWAMVFGVSLALAGCGGKSTPQPQAAPLTSPNSGTPPKAAVQTKGKGGSLAEGGDVTAQERRAARLKEKNAAGK